MHECCSTRDVSIPQLKGTLVTWLLMCLFKKYNKEASYLLSSLFTGVSNCCHKQKITANNTEKGCVGRWTG